MGLPNTFPFEVIGAPFSVYVAAAATARPAITAAPGIAWTLLGTRGPLSYSEEGVQVELPQSFNAFRSLGSAAPLKLFRSEEDAFFQITMADLTLAQLQQALNQNAVTSTPGTPGSHRVGLSRGLIVSTVALLVRGPSPYGDDLFSQFWVPYAANISNIQIQVRRDQATAYQMRWQAIVNPAAATPAEQLGIYEAADPLVS